MTREIYLDHNATTPCDPLVVEKMLPFFREWFGNPANGLHRQGQAAARGVEEARQQVAGLIHAHSKEIRFTSGATESNNLAILGVAKAAQNRGRYRIITSAVEHKAVLLPCKRLQEMGFEVVILSVDAGGQVVEEHMRETIDEQTLLVSIQAANNEIGTLQPIPRLAEIAHEYGVLVHCDAAQAIGKMVVDVEEWGVDMLSMSAHKFYGPKGVGALYLRGGDRQIQLEPLMVGGGQEWGQRAGTMNVPAIVGFGEAARLCSTRLSNMERVAGLRDDLEARLRGAIPKLRINGTQHPRLPNTSSFTLPGIEAEALVLNLPTVMLGTGSACTSGALEPSHVLQAIGLDYELAFATVRASLGHETTAEDIQEASSQIIAAWIELSAQLA